MRICSLSLVSAIAMRLRVADGPLWAASCCGRKSVGLKRPKELQTGLGRVETHQKGRRPEGDGDDAVVRKSGEIAPGCVVSEQNNLPLAGPERSFGRKGLGGGDSVIACGGAKDHADARAKSMWRDLFETEPLPTTAAFSKAGSPIASRNSPMALKPETIKRLEAIATELDGGTSWHQESGGRRRCQSVTCWNACAARNSVGSLRCVPISCTPMGMPTSAIPHGKVMEGTPARL